MRWSNNVRQSKGLTTSCPVNHSKGISGERRMEISTPQEFFEKVLSTKFKGDKAKDFTATAQVDITGPEGGQWIITIKDQKFQTAKGVAPKPDITLKMKDTDFVALVNSQLNAVQAFMTGKLEFQGSMAKGLKLLDMGFI
jgi:putative sterol carrier protein